MSDNISTNVKFYRLGNDTPVSQATYEQYKQEAGAIIFAKVANVSGEWDPTTHALIPPAYYIYANGIEYKVADADAVEYILQHMGDYELTPDKIISIIDTSNSNVSFVETFNETTNTSMLSVNAAPGFKFNEGTLSPEDYFTENEITPVDGHYYVKKVVIGATYDASGNIATAPAYALTNDEIDDTKARYERTAYVYDATANPAGWRQLNLDVAASNVIIDQDINKLGNWENVGNIQKDNNKITAGTTVQALFDQIFNKDNYPTVTKTMTFTASQNKPTVSLSVDTIAGSTSYVLPNADVSATASMNNSASGTTVNTTMQYTVSGMTNGYIDTANGNTYSASSISESKSTNDLLKTQNSYVEVGEGSLTFTGASNISFTNTSAPITGYNTTASISITGKVGNPTNLIKTFNAESDSSTGAIYIETTAEVKISAESAARTLTVTANPSTNWTWVTAKNVQYKSEGNNTDANHTVSIQQTGITIDGNTSTYPSTTTAAKNTSTSSKYTVVYPWFYELFTAAPADNTALRTQLAAWDPTDTSENPNAVLRYTIHTFGTSRTGQGDLKGDAIMNINAEGKRQVFIAVPQQMVPAGHWMCLGFNNTMAQSNTASATKTLTINGVSVPYVYFGAYQTGTGNPGETMNIGFVAGTLNNN